MRVVTLLPAATEMVAALGGAGQLVGISHECDYPPGIRHLPRVTLTPVDPAAPGAGIDAQVRALRDQGRPVIGVDAEQLTRLAPDLIITQELCDVCAVAGGEVHRLVDALSPPPQVLSLAAHNLAGIWGDIRAVGSALDLASEADELVAGLMNRLRRLRSGDARASQAVGIPRVICVEWLEPLYLAGHWVPELVALAGGEDVGAEAGQHSERREWKALQNLRPDLILVLLCGFDVERAQRELAEVADPVARRVLESAPIWVLDGNAYTSRPGPRVVDGAERMVAALRDEQMDGMQRWRPAA